MMRGGFASVALVVSSLVALAGQTPKPTFEVASVRTIRGSNGLPDGFAMNPRRSGGRVTWTTTLYDVTMHAYQLPGWRLVGMKREQEYYRIEATFDEPASSDDVRQMFRQLLVNRFKLVAHTTREERSGYALVFRKDGTKPRVISAAAGVPPMPEWFAGQPINAFDGYVISSMEGRDIGAMTGRRVPLSELANKLSEELKVFVLDETGMAGNYYFGFKFRRGVDADPDAPEAPLLQAVQDELGFRLEPRKGPVELLVVDHVETVPSEN
jgi:uncharacterized protein (TIGR03435 family)